MDEDIFTLEQLRDQTVARAIGRDIKHMVDAVIDQRYDPDAIAFEIMVRHCGDISGRHKKSALDRAYDSVRDAVHSAFNTRKAKNVKARANSQLTFPFVCFQHSYSVKQKNGKREQVPYKLLEFEECISKLLEFDGSIAGLETHRNEFYRFTVERFPNRNVDEALEEAKLTNVPEEVD
jgi:hypothetical protein